MNAAPAVSTPRPGGGRALYECEAAERSVSAASAPSGGRKPTKAKPAPGRRAPRGRLVPGGEQRAERVSRCCAGGLPPGFGRCGREAPAAAAVAPHRSCGAPRARRRTRACRSGRRTPTGPQPAVEGARGGGEIDLIGEGSEAQGREGARRRGGERPDEAGRGRALSGDPLWSVRHVTYRRFSSGTPCRDCGRGGATAERA